MSLLGIQIENKLTLGSILTIVSILAGGIYAVAQRSLDMDALIRTHAETKQEIKTLAAENKAEMKAVATVVQDLREKSIETNANRFTSNDWVKAKEVIDTRFNAHDVRINRNEGGIESLREAQKRIEAVVGKPAKP